jgi:hypothetical protein
LKDWIGHGVLSFEAGVPGPIILEPQTTGKTAAAL